MNPYHKFLELPESETAPDHYGLLGVPRFCDDAQQIHAALVARSTQLRSWDNSKFFREANALLDEVVAAAAILEDPIKRAAYDVELRQRLGLAEPRPTIVAAPAKIIKKSPATGGFDAGIKAGDRRVIKIDGVEFSFRYCPPGTFQMGTPANERGRLSNEDQVEVTLTQGFGMLETEVTQAMYLPVKKERPWEGKPFVKDGSNYPAVYVNWNDAIDYCQKLTAAGRSVGVLTTEERIALPTEAQWEYAARARTATAYFFGSDAVKLREFAWYDANAWDIGKKYAHLVGQKKPNPWGLLDQSGNVEEWCYDNYARQLPGGINPRGPSAGSSRVLRGGSFGSSSLYCRVGYRYNNVPTYSRCDTGFRVIVSVE